jgi:hypothetical protein
MRDDRPPMTAPAAHRRFQEAQARLHALSRARAEAVVADLAAGWRTTDVARACDLSVTRVGVLARGGVPRAPERAR